MTAPVPTQPPQAHGLRRWVYVGLGWLFVVLAVLGVLLPGVPTTPFVLLAGYYFARSSPRLHRWLRHSRLFGQLLHDWEEKRGVRRHVKFLAVALIVVAISCSIVFGNLSWWLVALLVGLGTIGLVVVLRLRVVDDRPLPGAAAVSDQNPVISEVEA